MAINESGNGDLRKAFDAFMGEVAVVIEARVRERVLEEVGAFIDEQVRLGVADELSKFSETFGKTTRKERKTFVRPCPVEGCTEKAASRHQNVCKHHSKTLSRDEIILARDRASQPGGIWYEMKKAEDSE